MVILAVSSGCFTSMSQALIGALSATGPAWGCETARRLQLPGIARGWAMGLLFSLCRHAHAVRNAAYRLSL